MFIPILFPVSNTVAQATDNRPSAGEELLKLLSLGPWGIRPDQREISKAIIMVRSGVNVRGEVGEQALASACLIPDSQTPILIDELLAHGAGLTHGADGCLVRAAEFAPYSAVISILQHDSDIATDGTPALLRAAYRGDLEIFLALLSHGASWPLGNAAIELVDNAAQSGNAVLLEKILTAKPYQNHRKHLAIQAFKTGVDERFLQIIKVAVALGVERFEPFDSFPNPFQWASNWYSSNSSLRVLSIEGVDFRKLPPRAAPSEILIFLSPRPINSTSPTSE